jgi:flagellin
MGLRINTNVMSLQAQRHLQNHTTRLMKSMERLSSGLRINRASDDPAGLAISERMKAQIRALDVLNRNAADGISLVQVAEGGMDTTSDLLIRMKELATQSLNGTLTDSQRGYLDTEFQTLKEEVDRIGRSTEFNGINLLDGALGTMNLRIGIGSAGAGTLAIDMSQDATTGGLGIDGLDILQATDASARAAMDGLESAIGLISGHRAKLGAHQNRLESIIRQNLSLSENLSAANSRIRDVDIAAEMSEMTNAQILQQVAVSILAQANSQPNLIIRLLERNYGR